MMKRLFYSILMLGILFSCKKEPMANDDSLPSSNSTYPSAQVYYSINESASLELPPASIYYTAITPQYTLQYNVNKDTLIHYFIDLNADQINDFQFTLQRKQYLWCANPESYAYGTVISVVSLDGANAITTGNGNILTTAAYSYYSPNTQLLDSGVVISGSAYQFNKQSEILFNKAMGFGMFIDFIGDKYLPLKFKNNHFGWIRMEGFDLFQGKIVLKGFAYNGTKDSPIMAGQTSVQ